MSDHDQSFIYIHESALWMFGASDQQSLTDCVGECFDKWSPESTFDVDAQPDRVEVRVGGLEPAASAMQAVLVWVQGMKDVGKRTFNVRVWGDRFEVRNRLDVDLVVSNYKADLGPSGSYRVTAKNGVEVGALDLTQNGWVGTSTSTDSSLRRERTDPDYDPQTSLKRLLTDLGLISSVD